jgi:hypothetical protein
MTAQCVATIRTEEPDLKLVILEIGALRIEGQLVPFSSLLDLFTGSRDNQGAPLGQTREQELAPWEKEPA